MAHVSKSDIRAKYRALRDRLRPDEVRERSVAVIERLRSLTEFANATTVFTYVSVNSEVATRTLIENLWASGITVAVPALLGEILEPYEILDWSDVEVDRYGRCSPIQAKAYQGRIDVNLVPGIALDRQGNRIGSGYGHYDRFIQAHPDITHIGLAFGFQIIDEIPIESHDQRLDYVVTETQLIRSKTDRLL